MDLPGSEIKFELKLQPALPPANQPVIVSLPASYEGARRDGQTETQQVNT